ncbi:MAG: PTS fructose transporter subunit IIA [Atopobiaceae bacterium]|nr:PTS fructose transporter subunit IIA [Atopobiaceae bacterium]MCI2174198.1 PTS fructose transporter subunit IIA [Atopobiaceae bacterium]MCI2206839.1 PTS fructose transporter subunit IIA [Atopobiaceae bacterium]
MVGVVLTGHGQFAPGLASALEMVAGPQQSFVVVPFDEAAAGEYGDTLRSAIADLAGKCEGVVVFVDLLGGTPFNQSMMISSVVPGVEVVCGTNLPMLIECMFMRGSDTSSEQLVATALAAGTAGVIHKTLEPAGEGAADDEEDGL